MAILMPQQDCQVNITVQGVQLKRTTGLQGLIQIIIVCRLWASKRGGATLTLGVNAPALSVIQKARKLDP